MKRFLFVILFALASTFLFAQISIYDIQYTTDAGDGSYPSLYNGQKVTTGGIVTATDYLGGRYFISSSKGGAWEGLFIYDNTNAPTIGDSVLVTGALVEYQGYTELKDLTSFEVKSTSNTLPETAKVSTINVTSEPFEGVLVEVNNCNASSIFDDNGNWSANDGSGVCYIRTGIFNLMTYGFPLLSNYSFNSVIGVIGINYGSISIQPRFIEDIQSSEGAFILTTEDKNVFNNYEFELPITIAILNQTESINTYALKMQYDASVFEYIGFNKTGTISESGTVSDISTSGNIIINFSGSITCSNIQPLLKLKFVSIITGNANLQFNQPEINGTELTDLSIGNLESFHTSECDIPIGDTLTLVQRPVLNIPSIVVPEQELSLICFAPETTTAWDAELFYDDVIVSLSITESSYDSELQRWTLKTIIPDVDLYELYDLRVSASGGILDEVTNAVKIIDQYKENYYFIHITDTHLPTHIFYGEEGDKTDTSELNDLYEVIKDINLIRPEFVLLTGDLINEGELEDFECRRNHTKSIRLLQSLEVPVYIVPGNHDLGGWDATPPPQGTARREWWRFFGWRQREIPPVKTEYYTHDYSFDYGNVHFVGLESYDNYDRYMYDVYGDESFISSQITWLNNDLAAVGDKTKVLFYHFDFKGELNFSNLGVDMALWGHTHKNAGDINSHPYLLSTASVCDENRVYRVIRVTDGDLQAENSIRTHVNGEMLTINYNMVNDGSLDSVSATINNRHYSDFGNGIVKFEMPLSDYGYFITNGTLDQIMEKGSTVICYVKVNIPSNDEIIVSIKKNLTEITQINDVKAQILFQNYPNPFSVETNIEYNLTQTAYLNISVYDLSGKLVEVLVDEKKFPGDYSITWDGTNAVDSKIGNGTYFCVYSLNGKKIDSKQMIFLH